MRLAAATAVVLALAGPASAQSLFITADDARLVGTGTVAVTPAVSSVNAVYDGESERFGTLLGTRVTFGARGADLSVAFDRLQFAGGEGGANFVTVSAKVPIRTN